MRKIKLKTYAHVDLTAAVEDEVLLDVVAAPKAVLSPTTNNHHFVE